MSVGKVMLRGEAEGQGLSPRAERCLTSSLSSSPIGLSRPAPPAPGIPAYAGCCCFFSGLLGGMVVSGVLLFVQSFCVECDESWEEQEEVEGIQ